MLNMLRENLRHLQWVLWLTAASMVLYLGYYFIEDDSSPARSEGWAAKVGDQVVSSDEFFSEARRRDDFYRRLLGGQYEQLKPQIRLGVEVAQRLVDRRIVLAEAKKLGLEATKREIANRITNDPSFRDASGAFVGKERYLQIVRSFWGDEAAYERAIAEDLVVQKWSDLVTEPVRVEDADLERIYRQRNETAAVDYVFVPNGSRPFDGSISEAEEVAWHRAHEDDYRRGEARRIRAIVLDRDSRIVRATPTEAEIEAYWRDNSAQFERAEQRRASHVLLRIPPGAGEADRRAVRDLAESIAARARAGEDFATLARTLSQDPDTSPGGGDLGFAERGRREPSLDGAIFATEAGQVAPVVESSLGFHVVKVTDVRAGGPAPLVDVRPAIERVLAVRRADALAAEDALRIAEGIRSPADLDEAARKEGVVVEEILLSRDEPDPRLGASPEFLSAVFAASPGTVVPPARVARGSAIAAVVDVLPPAVRPLAEVRDRVRTDILNDRGRKAAIEAGRAALAAAGDLAGAAKRLGLEVKSSGNLARGRPLPGAGVSPELERALFGTGATEGDRGVVEAEGGAIVYKITSRTAFDPRLFEEAKAALRDEALRQRRDALLQEVLLRLRLDYAVEWNQPLIERANG